jgi:hypothetical protein
MILNPATLALQITALLVAAMGIYAGYYGIRILAKWDLGSGSEEQLELERRTYLISTIMSCILVFELMSLFLYVYTADSLHTLFTGAMCAAGTLAVSSFGYPVLLLKVVNFVLAGVWLIVNLTDNRGYDYPLIRIKYELLNLVVPLLVLESCLLFAYFAGVKPDVITSCCGSLFSNESKGLSGDLATLPTATMMALFFGSMVATILSGLWFYLKRSGGYLFSLAATATFAVSLASLISFICLYFYELPTHHCPFCLLQKEYHYIGYLLYASLFSGGVAGIGVGVLMPFRKVVSLATIIPIIQRRLTLISLISYLLFTLITLWKICFSALRLG